ncbi:MAG TPA: hypothetical protein VMA83_12855 [Solirubrobacteraceae bacterium]|nr:hypothetical protein [Solirubrobacteraceae bacterium]
MFVLALSSGGGIAIAAVAYVILFLWLGLRSIKHGHWIMFLLGIPIPIFWIIGGLMPPVQRATE